MKKVNVQIRAEGFSETFSIRSGKGLQALCAEYKTPFEFDCRNADCGICIFKVTKGIDNRSAPTEVEADFLKAMRAGADERSACQCRVLGDVSISVEF